MALTPAGKLENFGFDRRRRTPTLPALHLLYSSPRVFEPFAQAWNTAHPGVLGELRRLTGSGLVAHQPAVMMDVRTQELSDARPRSVPRWRATAKGRRLHAQVCEDSRVLLDAFPNVTANEWRIALMLELLAMPDKHAKIGISVSHLAHETGLDDRQVRWWVDHLSKKGLAVKLPVAVADVRAVVPAHWRATSALTRQLRTALAAYPSTAPAEAVAAMQINRADFLADIVPSRVGLSGATDYDHDVTVQTLVGRFITGTTAVNASSVRTEPRFALTADLSGYPWLASAAGTDVVIYQPDAVLAHTGTDGAAATTIVEYERFQSRRDGWCHLEKFVAARNLHMPLAETVVLRFVVDSKARETGYVRLCEAFATWLADTPDFLPMRTTTLMVSSRPRLDAAADPLDPRHWSRLTLPTGGGWEMALHAADRSPFGEFF